MVPRKGHRLHLISVVASGDEAVVVDGGSGGSMMLILTQPSQPLGTPLPLSDSNSRLRHLGVHARELS